MTSNHKKSKTPAVAGPGLSEKTDNACKPFLANVRRKVNESWAHRAVDACEIAAEALREAVGGRV